MPVPSDLRGLTELLMAGGVVGARGEGGGVAADEEAEELLLAAGGTPHRLDAMVARRLTGEPLAWITGSVTWCGLEIAVLPGVYVPRWHTEPLAGRAAEPPA